MDPVTMRKKDKKYHQKRANALNINLKDYYEYNIDDQMYRDIMSIKNGDINDIISNKLNDTNDYDLDIYKNNE